MSEFIAINTQEEFNERIKDRLKREHETAIKEAKADYEAQLGELETLKKANADYEKAAKEKADNIASIQAQLDEANKKIKGFETENLRRKVASEAGLPDTLAGRLHGETEEEMKEDAKGLAEVFKQNNRQGLPMANLDEESAKGEQDKIAYENMLNNLTEGE